MSAQRPTRRREVLAVLAAAWRQLTSMRTALLLLFLLALAAVPGSLLPQRGTDPAAVARYLDRHRTIGPFLDRLSAFDVFGSPWFGAVYALLFISLVGCVVPRSRRHLLALIRKPPATPAHPARLAHGASWTTEAPADAVVTAAREELAGRRFRTATEPTTVAAEKGYLRETGNLVFHLALVALLAGVALGGLYGYQGKVITTEGAGFTNSALAYDSFSSGPLVDRNHIDPFTVRLRHFDASYQPDGTPKDFRADVDFRPQPGAPAQPKTIKVNDPLGVGNAKVYLINHGYSIHVRLRNATGGVVYDADVVCQPTDARNLTSSCVVKIPDTGLPPSGELQVPQQLAVTTTLVPTLSPGDFAGSAFPALLNPRLVATQVYLGDLGLDAGAPQSVYAVDTSRMTLLTTTGPGGTHRQFQMIDPRDPSANTITGLPNGMMLTFDGIGNFAVFTVKNDPGKGLALVAAGAMLVGLLLSLSVRRRRIWVRAVPQRTGRTLIEVGGLARTGDLTDEFAELVAAMQERAPEDGSAAGESVPEPSAVGGGGRP